MAEKKTALSIVISTVDKASAGIRAISSRMDKLTAPARAFGKSISEISTRAGLPKIANSLHGVGSALSGLVVKAAGVTAAIVGIGYGIKGIANDYETLGDRSTLFGITADSLAELQYAALKAGSSGEALAAGFQQFSTALGEAKAGRGLLTKFLKVVSPALLKQLKNAKDNETAFNLLADAMAKVEDPAKRLALAQKALGKGELATLLSRGSKGIEELRAKYRGLAGSQEQAVTTSGAVNDAWKDMGAVIAGLKAAIVVGFGPALKTVFEQLQKWFAENREKIAKWATEIGEKIPDAINDVVDAANDVVDAVLPVVDSLGGVKTVAAVLAAVILGPLVRSIVTLGVTILTTPIGWIMAGIALLVGGVYLLIKNWDKVSDFFSWLWSVVKNAFLRFFNWVNDIFLAIDPIVIIRENWEGITDFFDGIWDKVVGVFEWAWGLIKPIVDKVSAGIDVVKGGVDAVKGVFTGPSKTFTRKSLTLGGAANSIPSGLLTGRASTETRVKIDLANAPMGTRATTDPTSTGVVDLRVGYQMRIP